MKNEIRYYSNSVLIERFSLQKKISIQESEIRFEELKSFLYQCSLSTKPLRPSKQIDEIWHEFILFTREYHHFCNCFLGKFIHHEPKLLKDFVENNVLEFTGVCDGGGDCDTGGSNSSEW